jgi:hypothetical protein
MPRRLKVQTREMGVVEVYLLRSDEPEWEALAETAASDLVSRMPRSTLEHALHGWSRPFVDALGLPPEGAIRKLPSRHHLCALRKRCAAWHNALCRPTAKKMPICFEPDGLPNLAAEVVRLWREGVYVVVTQEDA